MEVLNLKKQAIFVMLAIIIVLLAAGYFLFVPREGYERTENLSESYIVNGKINCIEYNQQGVGLRHLGEGSFRFHYSYRGENFAVSQGSIFKIPHWNKDKTDERSFVPWHRVYNNDIENIPDNSQMLVFDTYVDSPMEGNIYHLKGAANDSVVLLEQKGIIPYGAYLYSANCSIIGQEAKVTYRPSPRIYIISALGLFLFITGFLFSMQKGC